MKLYDSNLEILALRTIIQSDKGGLPMLSKLKVEHFGSDTGKEIISRVLVFVANGKGIPNIELLKQDMALSEEARVTLATHLEPLDTEEDVSVCLDGLNKYRTSRIIYESLKKSTEVMTSSKEPDVNSVLTLFENAVLRCRSSVEKSEMEHIDSNKPDDYDGMIDQTLSATAEEFIPSGFAYFDKEYGGFSRGNVVLLTAPSGRAKSAMMLRMGILQYMMGLNVCVVSFEMTNTELRERMFASVSKMDHQDIRLKRLLDQQKKLIKKAMRSFVDTGYGNRLTLWGCSENLDVNDIAASIRHMKYDVVYIDYLGLLKQPKDKQQHEALGMLTRDAKMMAKQNDCVVVPLAQLDDETLKIKYSKAIKANCDFIWSWELNEKEKEMGILKIDQQKVRHGADKPFYLRHDLSRMLFTDYDGPEPNLKMEEKKPMPRMNIG